MSSSQINFKYSLQKIIGLWYLCNIYYIDMFEFDQYLGFLAFLTILTIGFWLMIFLLLFVVPYWLGGNIIELLKEKRDAKRAKQNA